MSSKVLPWAIPAGPYVRRQYKCSACEKTSWVEEARTTQGGTTRKQSRGLYDLCQYCFEVDRRLIKALKGLGYTHIGRDGVQFEQDGIFSMILWFREPEAE